LGSGFFDDARSGGKPGDFGSFPAAFASDDLISSRSFGDYKGFKDTVLLDGISEVY
jgi:hypothetical protein